jgi:hypothetical protein
MPWVKFTGDYDFRPPEKPRVCIAYKSGMVQFVRRICAARALAKSRAVIVERPVIPASPDDAQSSPCHGRGP